jgi:hypothetical protein
MGEAMKIIVNGDVVRARRIKHKGVQDSCRGCLLGNAETGECVAANVKYAVKHGPQDGCEGVIWVAKHE